jgi:hypothetical protein
MSYPPPAGTYPAYPGAAPDAAPATPYDNQPPYQSSGPFPGPSPYGNLNAPQEDSSRGAPAGVHLYPDAEVLLLY